MFRSILVPVDLAHAGALDRALRLAAEVAKLYGAKVTYLGVCPEQGSEIAGTPEEFDRKLEAFAAEEGKRFGIEIAAVTISSPDIRNTLDRDILEMVDELEADCVVMGTHMPGLLDHLVAGHAPYVATHAQVTVMVVR